MNGKLLSMKANRVHRLRTGIYNVWMFYWLISIFLNTDNWYTLKYGSIDSLDSIIFEKKNLYCCCGEPIAIFCILGTWKYTWCDPQIKKQYFVIQMCAVCKLNHNWTSDDTMSRCIYALFYNWTPNTNIGSNINIRATQWWYDGPPNNEKN